MLNANDGKQKKNTKQCLLLFQFCTVKEYDAELIGLTNHTGLIWAMSTMNCYCNDDLGICEQVWVQVRLRHQWSLKKKKELWFFKQIP